MNGLLRVAAACLLALAACLLVLLVAMPIGCGGSGAEVSRFAGSFEGIYVNAANTNVRGDIKATIAVDGTLSLSIDAQSYVGRVLPSGVVAGIPPIGGTFEINSDTIFFLLARPNGEGLIGYMDRVGSPPSGRSRWHDVEVEAQRFTARLRKE